MSRPNRHTLRRPSRHTPRRSDLIAAAAAVAFGTSLSLAAPALAAHRTFGSTAATPTLDTANGARSNTGSTVGSQHAVLPNPHEAEDLGVWNAPASGATRAVNGQALQIKVKGCAVKDTSAPTQLSAGTAVNTILFQALAPVAGGGFNATATTGQFLMPFCSNSQNPATGRISTSTVTSFTPLHLCLANGDAVALHDIGGFIPPQGGKGPWYPQGIPLDVIARVGGATLDSFVGAGTTQYGPGRYGSPEPNQKQSGFATAPGEQLEMQVIEGTGGDAYGLCPGGTATEPTTSNKVICDNGKVTKGHRKCGAAADIADTVRRVAIAASAPISLF